MKFPGLTKAEFTEKYANGVVSALASVTEQPASAITVAAIREEKAAAAPVVGAGGARKLLQEAAAGQTNVSWS